MSSVGSKRARNGPILRSSIPSGVSCARLASIRRRWSLANVQPNAVPKVSHLNSLGVHVVVRRLDVQRANGRLTDRARGNVPGVDIKDDGGLPIRDERLDLV